MQKQNKKHLILTKKKSHSCSSGFQTQYNFALNKKKNTTATRQIHFWVQNHSKNNMKYLPRICKTIKKKILD